MEVWAEEDERQKQKETLRPMGLHVIQSVGLSFLKKGGERESGGATESGHLIPVASLPDGGDRAPATATATAAPPPPPIPQVNGNSLPRSAFASSFHGPAVAFAGRIALSVVCSLAVLAVRSVRFG
uniref:Uncharacterized protein n=1 Tax=Leersia perrieri TaxID=77586 RepID=A0A0D9WE91_9ORYZ